MGFQIDCFVPDSHDVLLRRISCSGAQGGCCTKMAWHLAAWMDNKTACCLVCLQFTSKNQGVVLSASQTFFHVRQVIGKCPSPASATTDIFFGESQPGRGPCLRLHGLGETNSASVRFQRPLVLPQLIIGIDTLVAGTQGVK